MSSDFVPQNELECRLLEAEEGRIAPEGFIKTLLGSEVFLPICEKHQIGGSATDHKAKPLELEAEDGSDVLVLFTNPERAKGFVRDYPGYGGGLVVELNRILERPGIGCGISLNPGQDAGIDLQAQGVAQIATLGDKPNRASLTPQTGCRKRIFRRTSRAAESMGWSGTSRQGFPIPPDPGRLARILSLPPSPRTAAPPRP